MGSRRRQRRKTLALVAVAVLAGGIGVFAYATHLLSRSELQTIDARFAIRGTRKPPSDIVLVQITRRRRTRTETARSRLAVPAAAQATTPRSIDRLRRAGAKAIAMDMEFTHETDPAEDNELIEAIARAHGKAVLGTALGSRARRAQRNLGGGNSCCARSAHERQR